MRASCWILCLKKSAITFGEGCKLLNFSTLWGIFSGLSDLGGPMGPALSLKPHIIAWDNTIMFWIDQVFEDNILKGGGARSHVLHDTAHGRSKRMWIMRLEQTCFIYIYIMSGYVHVMIFHENMLDGLNSFVFGNYRSSLQEFQYCQLTEIYSRDHRVYIGQGLMTVWAGYLKCPALGTTQPIWSSKRIEG